MANNKEAINAIVDRLSRFAADYSAPFLATHTETRMNEVIFSVQNLNLTDQLWTDLKHNFPGVAYNTQTSTLSVPIHAPLLASISAFSNENVRNAMYLVAAGLLFFRVVL